MRKVIRRRIRHTQDGLDLALDLNADVAINVGPSRPADVADAAEEAERPVDDPARPEANDDERNEQ
jgi:hypothetical protein